MQFTGHIDLRFDETGRITRQVSASCPGSPEPDFEGSGINLRLEGQDTFCLQFLAVFLNLFQEGSVIVANDAVDREWRKQGVVRFLDDSNMLDVRHGASPNVEIKGR